MKLKETKYNIELTTEDIEHITRALQGEYKFCKEITIDVSDERYVTRLEELNKKIKDVRELRNNFGSIIGVRYMGSDA